MLIEAHHLLARLAGTWEGPETLAPSPWSPGGPSTGSHRFRLVAGGHALAQDYASPTLDGHGVFSIDPETGDLLHHWFDSFGFPPLQPARGEIADNALTVTRSSARGTNRTTLTLDGDRLLQRVELRPPDGGDFATLVTGEYRRAG